jgi:hypothetical protein
VHLKFMQRLADEMIDGFDERRRMMRPRLSPP